MPAGIISLTEGSGAKKARTWQRTVGANTVEEQFFQLAEPPMATFIALAQAISGATVDSHILQLMSGASVYLRVHRIFIEQSGNATTAATPTFAIRRLTTAGTGGTSVTPAPFDTADTAASTAMTLPSSKGTEGVTLFRQAINARQAVSTTQTNFDDAWEWRMTPGRKPIIVPAGTANGLAVVILSATAGSTWNVHIEYGETAEL